MQSDDVFLFSNLFYLFPTLAHEVSYEHKYDRGTVGVPPRRGASAFVLPRPKLKWGASEGPSKPQHVQNECFDKARIEILVSV